MELLMISFAAAWIARGFIDGRRADYRSPDNGYQRDVVARRASEPQHRMSGPDMRYALGWSAHQLRHGWPQMIADVKGGWADARKAYEQWRTSQASGGKDGKGGASSRRRPGFMDGWRQARRAMPAPWWKQPARSEPSPDAGTADGDAARKPAPSVDPTTSVPFNTASNGAAAMTAPTGEASGITPYRAHLNTTIEYANKRIELAQAEITQAEQEIASHDNVNAQLAAEGMGAQTTGEMAAMVEAAMARKAAAENKLTAAEAEKARAEKALSDLDTQGHTNVEEAVKGASAPVASTTFYEN
jgi:hypothetical protein